MTPEPGGRNAEAKVSENIVQADTACVMEKLRRDEHGE